MLFQILSLPLVLYASLRYCPKSTLRFLSGLIAPFVKLYIQRRISNNLEDAKRKDERFGIPSAKRPKGDLIWIHAVSVGETLSVIPIIDMIKEQKDVTILLTTTTLTAATQVQERLAGKVIHQFIPFDVFKWIRRFIKYWKPSLVFFVESELWPNALYYLQEKNIPTYLLNARISNKSLRRLSLVKKILNIEPLNSFTKIFVPTQNLKDSIRKLGAQDVELMPNIKIISERLPVDQEKKSHLAKKIYGRENHCWIAVSTHPGEESIVIEVHKELKSSFPDILTIIAIRHPDRRDEVMDLTLGSGLSASCYTDDSFQNDDTISEDILILDKIGCLGAFFETVNTVLVCGSLIPGIGGHNFLEPINFACNVASGKYIDNFKDLFDYASQYCKIVNDSRDIQDFVSDSFENYSKNQAVQNNLDIRSRWMNSLNSILKHLG